MKNRERYVVAHTILRRIVWEIKIGPLKRISVRGAKWHMRHHRPIDMCQTKKIDYIYMVQFSTSSLFRIT